MWPSHSQSTCGVSWSVSALWALCVPICCYLWRRVLGERDKWRFAQLPRGTREVADTGHCWSLYHSWMFTFHLIVLPSLWHTFPRCNIKYVVVSSRSEINKQTVLSLCIHSRGDMLASVVCGLGKSAFCRCAPASYSRIWPIHCSKAGKNEDHLKKTLVVRQIFSSAVEIMGGEAEVWMSVGPHTVVLKAGMQTGASCGAAFAAPV